MDNNSENGIDGMPVENQEKQVENTHLVQLKKPSEDIQNVEEITTGFSLEETEFLSNGSDKLREMLEIIDERDRFIAVNNTLLTEGRGLEGEIKQLKSNLESDINLSVKNAAIEATALEDKLLADENIRLKEKQQLRDKAKAKGIRERIDVETKDLTEENMQYRRNIKRGLKENGLPSFCDSKVFYIMYCSQTAVEWVIRLAAFLLMFVVIPGVILLIADPWWLWRLIWWVIIDVIILAIYMTIYLISKDKDAGILDEVRELRDRIYDNEKKIRQIKSNIKKDPDESSYNLGDYDEEIKKVQISIDDVTEKRNMKLKEFEEVIKKTIIDTLHNEQMPGITEKQSVLEEKIKVYNEMNQKLTSINQSIENKYERFLTKTFMNRQQLTRMLELIETNQATNIGQARDIIKNSSRF